MVKQTFVWCQECGQAVLSIWSDIDVPVIRGYVLCPDCLELIPEDVANAFFNAAKKAGQKRIEARKTMRAR